MSTATDGELIARSQRFERRLLEYMDAWLAWAPLMRAARAEAEKDLTALTTAIQGNGCDAAQARMSELENDMQPLAEEIIAAQATSLGGLRAKALVAHPALSDLRLSRLLDDPATARRSHFVASMM
jgi:hypothetical protein